MDNREPFIYKTTDFGVTWTKITGGLPSHQLSYVRVVAEDPNCKGLLFAGTGNCTVLFAGRRRDSGPI